MSTLHTHHDRTVRRADRSDVMQGAAARPVA